MLGLRLDLTNSYYLWVDTGKPWRTLVPLMLDLKHKPLNYGIVRNHVNMIPNSLGLCLLNYGWTLNFIRSCFNINTMVIISVQNLYSYWFSYMLWDSWYKMHIHCEFSPLNVRLCWMCRCTCLDILVFQGIRCSVSVMLIVDKGLPDQINCSKLQYYCNSTVYTGTGNLILGGGWGCSLIPSALYYDPLRYTCFPTNAWWQDMINTVFVAPPLVNDSKDLWSNITMDFKSIVSIVMYLWES